MKTFGSDRPETISLELRLLKVCATFVRVRLRSSGLLERFDIALFEYDGSLAMYIPGLLVSPERNKLSMSEMIAFGPLHEFKLAYKLGLKPSAFGHFGCRKASPPTATLGLRQIRQMGIYPFRAV